MSPAPTPTDTRRDPVRLRGETTKCCRDCAFRHGSRERSDPWAWMRYVEAWTNGGRFICHESVLGHPLEVRDGSPRNRLCAGWAATHGLPADALMRLANTPVCEALPTPGAHHA